MASMTESMIFVEVLILSLQIETYLRAIIQHKNKKGKTKLCNSLKKTLKFRLGSPLLRNTGGKTVKKIYAKQVLLA